MDKSTVWERFSKSLEQQAVLPETKEIGTEEKLANVIELLSKTLERQDEKAASNVHTAITLHDGGGIFSGPGLERDVITAHIRPQGILSVLPLLLLW